MHVEYLNPRNEFVLQCPKKNNLIKKITRSVVRQHGCGKRTLCEKMKNIFKQDNLSKLNTNHSIESTSVTILDKSRFEIRQIRTR